MKTKIWKLDEARDILPEIIEITDRAYRQSKLLAEELGTVILPENIQELKESELKAVLSEWALSIVKMGAHVKGLWLVDFDNGRGFYCWKFGEKDLLYEHTYESGFAGRKPIIEEL